MIVAITQNSAQSYRDFRKFNLYQKDRLTMIVGPVLLVVLGALMLFVNFLFGIVLLGLGILLDPFLILMMNLTTRKFLRNAGDYLATATKFEFGKETLTVTSMSPKPDQCVKGTLKYPELYSVYDTPKYLFLYLTKTRCLILPKCDLTSGSPEELSAFLQETMSPYRKYLRRK